MNGAGGFFLRLLNARRDRRLALQRLDEACCHGAYGDAPALPDDFKSLFHATENAR